MSAEDRIINVFRHEYARNRADLKDFDSAADAMTFQSPTEALAWCRQWWETRLQGRALDEGEQRLRGMQGYN